MMYYLNMQAEITGMFVAKQHSFFSAWQQIWIKLPVIYGIFWTYFNILNYMEKVRRLENHGRKMEEDAVLHLRPAFCYGSLYWND